MSQSFSVWVKDLFAKSPKRRIGKQRPHQLGFEQLEDRVVPAINILDTGAGTLDADLAADGIVNAASGTISRSAIEGFGGNISITCTNGDLTLDNLTTPLALSTGPGFSVSLIATLGSVVFADTTDLLSTAGGNVVFTASDVIALGSVETDGGSLRATANTDIILLGAINTNGGDVAVRADNDTDRIGTFTVWFSGSVACGDFTAAAANVKLDGTVSGDTVTLSQTGSYQEHIELGGSDGIGSFVFENEANNTLLNAQAFGTLGASPTSISGFGDGTFDYYSFRAVATEQIEFETLTGNFDTELFLYDKAGTLLAANDDFNGLLSYINYTFTADDIYVIGVGKYNSTGDPGGISGLAPQNGDDYQLVITSTNGPSAVWKLTDDELSRISATTLKIGTGSASASDIRVISPIVLTNVDNLFLESNGFINDSTIGEQADITVQNLAVVCTNNVGFGNAIDIEVQTLAAFTNSGRVNFSDPTDLTIGTVAGLRGITSNDPTLNVGGTLVVSSSDIGYASNLLTINAGALVVNGVISGQSSYGVSALITVVGNVTVNAGGSIDDLGAVTIIAGGSVTIAGTIKSEHDDVTITGSSITVTGTVRSDFNGSDIGSVILTATDAATAGNNLIVSAGALVAATDFVSLNAGDSITVAGTVQTGANKTITATVDAGNADAAGGTIDFTAATTANAATLVLQGGTAADTFTIAPQLAIAMTVNGAAPTTAPGDTLNIDLNGATSPVLTPGAAGAGAFTFNNRAALNFTGIETYNLANGTIALVVDMVALGFQNASANPDVVTISTDSGGVLTLTAQNGGFGPSRILFNGAASTVSSITINGSADQETFRVIETNPGIAPLTINANDPTSAPGDALELDFAFVTNPVLTTTGVGAGNYTFGNRNGIVFSGLEILPTPRVSVVATDDQASERFPAEPQDSALFTFTRTGTLTTPLTVDYSLLPQSGDSRPGRDYRPLSGTVTFLAGSAIATVQLDAINNGLVDFDRSVVLTIVQSSNYIVGPNGSAVVTILDNDVPLTGHVVSTGPGPESDIRIYGTDPLTPSSIITPFQGFSGGIVIARGDVNNDGFADIAVGVAGGTVPHVKVFDGLTGAELLSFYAFDESYRGGVTLAIGDLDGDGYGEVIVGAAEGVAHVKVFSGQTGAEVLSFFAYDDGRGNGAPVGVSVAAGDLNGDKIDEIVTGARSGPHIKVFDFQGNATKSFFAFFPPSSYGGINIAVGDLNGDGKDDIVAANTFGIQSRLSVIDSSGVILNTITLPKTNTIAPNLAVADVDGDGSLELLVAVGPQISFYSGPLLDLDFVDNPYADYNGNIYVGA